MRSSAVSSAGLLSFDRHLTTHVITLTADFSECGSAKCEVPRHGKLRRVRVLGSPALSECDLDETPRRNGDPFSTAGQKKFATRFASFP